jgi:sulfite oxidase
VAALNDWRCAGAQLTVRGYAWSGGGRGVVRVDVSADGGRSWTTARLAPPPPGAPPPGAYSGAWAWTLWEVRPAGRRAFSHA